MALACSVIVFRAFRSKSWFDDATKRVTSAAFMRRPRDRTGISVAFTPQEAERYLNSYGVASLHVGRVRDIGLDVVADRPPHAVITGLPFDEDDRREAERLAGLLARQARLVDD